MKNQKNNFKEFIWVRKINIKNLYESKNIEIFHEYRNIIFYSI